MNWNGLSGIDLGSIEEDTGSSTLSAGAHICRISDAELNKTKNGKGHRLAITLQSLDGGGQVIDYMNVHNENEQATEIGLTRLKTLLIKAGYKHATPDVAKMKGLQVGVHVVQGEDWHDAKGERRKGGGEPRQRNAYFAPSEQVAAASASVAGSTSTSDTGDFDDQIPF